MGQSVFTGPVIALGGLAGGPYGGPPSEYSGEIGPSLFFQGVGMPMPGRGSQDTKGQGAFPSLFFSSSIMALNQVLVAGLTPLTVTSTASSGVPLTKVTTYAAGIGIGAAAPAGAPGTPSTIGIALDPGYASCATTAGNAAVAVAANDAWRFAPGQFVSIAGAGPGGTMWFTKITSASGTSISVSPAPVTSQAAASIGPVAGDPNTLGWQNNAYSSLMNGGAGRFLLPDCAATRGVGITGVTGGVGGAILIQGLDNLMRPQSEVINVAAGAGTAWGRKTYKMFLNAIPQFTDSHNYTVVTSDLIGMAVSVVPNQPPPIITEAGAAYVGAVFQYADPTNPGTINTADPRGAVQLSANGPVAGGTGTGPDGSSRFTIVQMLNPAQVLASSVFNPAPLFGVPPV
jgi:hypothetical protein